MAAVSHFEIEVRRGDIWRAACDKAGEPRRFRLVRRARVETNVCRVLGIPVRIVRVEKDGAREVVESDDLT